MKEIDIKKPLQLVNVKDGSVDHVVSNVIFFNDNVLFCEVRPINIYDDELFGFLMFDRLSGLNYQLVDPEDGKGLKAPLSFYRLENYVPEPGPQMSLSLRAREYARSEHLKVCQTYDDRQYIYHLDMAAKFANQFHYLIPKKDFEIVLAGIYLHDVIEDPWSITYNNVKKIFGERVANIAYALSNEKGKTRAERANDKYYQGIRDTPYAVFAKICDRLANVYHGVSVNGHMVDGYRDEYAHFRAELYVPEYDDMFKHLEELFKEAEA